MVKKTYLGEDTDWTPPNPSNKERLVEGSCCSCGCETGSEKKIIVEYLYLDLEACDRCIGTDNVLDEVMMTLTPALSIAGFTATGYSCEEYKLPENLQEFYEGKKNKSSCSCGGGCC